MQTQSSELDGHYNSTASINRYAVQQNQQQRGALTLPLAEELLTATKPTILRSGKRKTRPSKQDLMLEVFGELAYCVEHLEKSKKEVCALEINYRCVFELIGGAGWNWLTEEQFTRGIE